MEDPRKTVSFVDMAAVSVQPDTNAYKKTEEFTMVTLTEQNRTHLISNVYTVQSFQD